jgi:hypothetical protein
VISIIINGREKAVYRAELVTLLTSGDDTPTNLPNQRYGAERNRKISCMTRALWSVWKRN